MRHVQSTSGEGGWHAVFNRIEIKDGTCYSSSLYINNIVIITYNITEKYINISLVTSLVDFGVTLPRKKSVDFAVPPPPCEKLTRLMWRCAK